MVYRDRQRTLNELKAAVTSYIRNISQADLQKVFVNKIKQVQACTDARGHHFYTSNTFYKCTATFRTHCIRLKVKLTQCLLKHQILNTHVGEEAELQPFLTSALSGGEQSAS